MKSTKSNKDIRLKVFFQLFYLGEEDDKVEIEEIEEINFVEIKKRLRNGESVFIAPKLLAQEKEKGITIDKSNENSAEHWYFTRM